MATWHYKRIVVKVGTNVLTRDDGSLDITSISHITDQLAALKKQGVGVVLVSSGAVGAGRELLPEAVHFDTVVRRQMLSAIGQVRLMELYRQLFSGHRLLCGQILATREDFRDRTHYLNMRNCIEALLHDQVVPILNENDAVSVTELMFTDNDQLASLVTTMLNADALIILSSVDGLFTAAPGTPDARLITELAAYEDAQQYVAPVKSSFGRGGMDTKLRMAQQTARLGADVILANGRRPNILIDVLNDAAPCTKVRKGMAPSSVKKWLAHEPDTKGSVQINEGAQQALTDANHVSSLLPVGIIDMKGDFKKGDLVRILATDNTPIGIGLAQYDAEQLKPILGKKGSKAFIHYDYLLVY
ncbi:MAG: glutamate 5-kinase [Saprospiraceae bacterium]